MSGWSPWLAVFRLQVMGPSTRPVRTERRGVRRTPDPTANARETAAENTFALTSNTRNGGIQLPSTPSPHGSRSPSRGRANTGARFVASGLSVEIVRWSAESCGMYETSIASSVRGILRPGATATADNPLAPHGTPIGENATED